MTPDAADPNAGTPHLHGWIVTEQFNYGDPDPEDAAYDRVGWGQFATDETEDCGLQLGDLIDNTRAHTAQELVDPLVFTVHGDGEEQWDFKGLISRSWAEAASEELVFAPLWNFAERDVGAVDLRIDGEVI